MCADRSPQRRQRATVGWMGPGPGPGRVLRSESDSKRDSAASACTLTGIARQSITAAGAMLHRPFGGFIMLLIILNTWCLAIDSHDQPTFESNWLSAMQPCPTDGPLPQARWRPPPIPLWLARRN